MSKRRSSELKIILTLLLEDGIYAFRSSGSNLTARLYMTHLVSVAKAVGLRGCDDVAEAAMARSPVPESSKPGMIAGVLKMRSIETLLIECCFDKRVSAAAVEAAQENMAKAASLLDALSRGSKPPTWEAPFNPVKPKEADPKKRLRLIRGGIE